jgi:hypothetical protein
MREKMLKLTLTHYRVALLPTADSLRCSRDALRLYAILP